MKKNLKFTLLSTATIFGLYTSPVSAQYTNPVGMRYVGSQQYGGQSATLSNSNRNVQYVAPSINSIYAKPMNRVSEIPLYGKNKSMYFYNQTKKNEGPFADSGLYMFAAFSTGNTTDGINLEHGSVDPAEADANDDMGTANGLSIGVGRVMSNTLSVEFMYSSYSGMKYGDWVKYYEEVEDESAAPSEDEDEDEDAEVPTITVVNDTDYEVISGGGINSKFIGMGFKYNLENMFGTILGRLKPYIGFQLGIAQNTIEDYTVSDEIGYEDDGTGEFTLPDLEAGETSPTSGEYSQYTDGEITFIGSTNRSLAFGGEAGFSLELEGNLSIDLFYKINNYGKVKTSGNILKVYNVEDTEFVLVQDIGLDEDPGSVCPDGFEYEDSNDNYTLCISVSEPYEEQSLTQRRVQSGDLTFHQYGIRLKYMF